MKDTTKNNFSKGEIVIYQTPKKEAELKVRLEKETVWLTQTQIALLFGTQRPAITKHLSNIFKCGELNKRKKHTYKCKSCGYEANSDYIAGRNIQQLFLAKCQEEQASINNASNIGSPEPKAKKDASVRNISIPPTNELVGILEVIL